MKYKAFRLLVPVWLGMVMAACGGGEADVAPAIDTPVVVALNHNKALTNEESPSQSNGIGTGIGSTLSPADLRTRYNMPPQYLGVGQTIAIVDAPGSGNIANDLNTFSSYYTLPLCNTANNCFQKIDLSNGRPVSKSNDWAIEIALDVEWAHAMAPAAKIILVIAASASLPDMMAAVRTAAAQKGVVAISMSWGAAEYSAETSNAYDGVFSSNPGMVFFAASGDAGNNGRNQIYPAASPYVTAVGGSSIKSLGASTVSNETAWSLGGGGASIFESMPSFQSLFLSGSNMLALNHGKRAIPDVAYNADPASSPVGVYANGSWYAVGGTSAGAPQWAAIMAQFAQYLQTKSVLLSSMVQGSAGFNSLIYQAKLQQASKSSFFDITTGSDNTGRGACVLCSARPGYDDVTGLGVPNVGNFLGYF